MHHARASLAFAVLMGISASFSLSYSFVPPSVVSAAEKSISADGEYIVGDGLDESLGVAKIRARQEAMRTASEQAGVYIESYTKTVNNELTKDEVTILSSIVLNVTRETYQTNDMNGQGLKVICRIEATVDSVKIDEALKQRREDAQKWQEMQKQNQELQAKIEKITKENEALKAEYQKAKSPDEKEEIQQQAYLNQKKMTVTDYINRGMDARRMKRYDEAIPYYTKAIQLDPQNATAYKWRGITYNSIKEYHQAIDDLTKAIRLNPEDGLSYSIRGNAYLMLNNVPEAFRNCNIAIQFNPNDFTAYRTRGDYFSWLKQYQKAIPEYDKAIHINPSDPWSYLGRGIAYGSIGQNKEAVRNYTIAIQFNPNFAPAYNNRGIAYYNLYQYSVSLKDARSIPVMPNNEL